MSQFDQVRSDTELPQYMLDLHSMDFQFAALKEKFTMKEKQESPKAWQRESVANFIFNDETLGEMNKFAPALAQWETDVQSGRFTAADDNTADQMKSKLDEHNRAAENFQSKCFTTLFG